MIRCGRWSIRRRTGRFISVFIDGRRVVDRGSVLTLDHANALAALTEAQGRMMAAVPGYDWARRHADQITPLSLTMINALN